MRRAWILLFSAGCGATRPDTTAAPEPGAEPAESAAEERCLPFVAAECGCVYPCARGRRDAEGDWTVHAEPWGDLPGARIDRFCAGGDCTDAFHVALVCTVTCEPRPADPTCHFEDGQCVGERD